MEEERRLFYVAITRAEKHCFLSYARSRLRYGKMEFGSRSRFLGDISPEFLDCKMNGQTSSIGRHDDVQLPWSRKPVQPSFPQSSNRTFSRPSVPTASVLQQPPSGYRRVESKPASSVSNNAVASRPANNQLAAGTYIEHERFGIGHVIKVEGAGDNMKATVEFRNAGTKQLLLRFARFKIITNN
jgi:DNA helicase-2/ATP-dependent DNA helicase PcrA